MVTGNTVKKYYWLTQLHEKLCFFHPVYSYFHFIKIQKL